MSKIPKKLKDKKNAEHQKYISRITKTLYYGKFPKPDGLSLPVTEFAAELFSEAQRGRSLDRLHCDDAANISRNACVSPCSLVIAILYLERLKKINPDFLERTASSDLFLVSLMVSCKFLYDDGETDEVFLSEWAASGGTTVKELIKLEKDFLKAIDWEVFVNELTFWQKLNEIERTLAKKQGLSRGFFTYTELQSLLSTVDLQNLFQNLFSLTAILIATYAIALLTLVGSVIIVSYLPGAYIHVKKIDQNYTLVPVTFKSDIYESETPSIPFKKPEFSTLDVVKTSIFLASIESFLKPFCNKTDVENNVQNVSWDWWTIPTMQWITETSASFKKNLEMEVPKMDFLNYLYDTYIQVKFLDLEDQIHKSTKTRIQNQIENSWHEEWTDTIKDDFKDRYIHYLQNVKS